MTHDRAISINKIKKYLFILFIGLFFLNGCDQQQTDFQHLTGGAIIVAFGDSLTFGTGANPADSYPANLALITLHRVINAGVPGEESSGGLARIKTVLDQYHPALVIVCLGGNDFLHKIPILRTKENLTAIVQIIQDSGAQTFLIGVPSISMSLMVPNLYNEIGVEMSIPVDVTILAGLEGQREYKSDYIHLNGAGYKILAQEIADYLQQHGAL
jgi:acyl-CoA thioesterase-1